MFSPIEVHWVEVRFREDDNRDQTLFHVNAIPFNMYAKITVAGEVRISEQEKFEVRAHLTHATEVGKRDFPARKGDR